MSSIPCLLCGNDLKQRTDKNNKPYFICDPCGIQIFVRRRHGIALLEKLIHTNEKNAIPFKRHAYRLFEVQALLQEIEGTKKQIKILDDEIGFFFPDEDKIRARNLLKTRIPELLDELEKLAQKSIA